MNDLRIVYRPLPEASSESELNALVAVYSFVLRRHEEKKKAVPADSPVDAKGSNKHDRATESISR